MPHTRLNIIACRTGLLPLMSLIKKEARFLSIERRNAIVDKAGLLAIRQIARGVFSLDEIVDFMGKSAYREGLIEDIGTIF